MALVNFQIRAFIFTILFVHSTLGLKCYICNSQKDPACSLSPPPEKYLQECSQDTLEILNDMHRQTKLQEAADQVAEKKDAESTTTPVTVEQPGNDASSAAIPVTSSPMPLDSNDKDMVLNRTARSSEEISHPVPTNNNGSAAPTVPFAPAPIKLPKEATFCRRVAYHIPTQTNGPNSTLKASVRVIRACGWIPEEKKGGEQGNQDGCKWIGTEGVQMDQCVCNSDGCNAGNYLGSLTLQTLILMAVTTGSYFYIL